MSEPIYVIGYARVSTPKQAQTGESLDAQENKIRKYCADMGYTLYPNNEVFREPFSGKDLYRPKYIEILELLKKNKGKVNIKYFVFWDFDRLTRGGLVDYNQIWTDLAVYGVEPRDTTKIIKEETDLLEEFGYDFSYPWAKRRQSEDEERNKAEDARKQKLKILQTLIIPEIKLTIEGYHIGRSDYGFQNKKVFVENKKKCIQERYESEAVFVERFYKLRAEGILSDQAICDDVNAMGYKSRVQNIWSKDKTKIVGTSGGNKLTPKHLQDIVKRFTYCGVICEKWTKYQPIKAKYNGLVTVDEWNKANRGKVFLEQNPNNSFNLLQNVSIHGKKRKRYNPAYPFKGVLMCEMCGKPMKASASTGESGKSFGAYHCERKHKRNAFPQGEVEKNYKSFIENIKFTNEFVEVFEKSTLLQFREKEGELSEYTAKANINVAGLEMEKSGLIKSFPSATLPEVRKGIEEEITKIQKQIDQAKNQRDKMELEEEDVTDFIGWCKDLMEHPTKLLEDIRSEQELLHTFSIFFEDLPTYTQIVSRTAKLSLVFKLSEQYKVDKSALVTPRRVELRLPA
jgi:hypothetical protein